MVLPENVLSSNYDFQTGSNFTEINSLWCQVLLFTHFSPLNVQDISTAAVYLSAMCQLVKKITIYGIRAFSSHVHLTGDHS